MHEAWSYVNIVDSFPIALAKDFHYYGCKLHVITNVRPKTTPFPEYALLMQASVHDLEAVREVFLNLENHKIYAVELMLILN